MRLRKPSMFHKYLTCSEEQQRAALRQRDKKRRRHRGRRDHNELQQGGLQLVDGLRADQVKCSRPRGPSRAGQRLHHADGKVQ
mgnify:CR=1 FL=1